MPRRGSALRVIALLGAGSLAVHELRYLAEFGTGAGRVLGETGHGYLPLFGSLLAVTLGVAVVRFASAARRALREGDAESSPASFGRLWTRCTLALLAVYALQEGLEGAFSPGHPAGILGILGHGGWTAALFAAAIGALAASLLHAAHAAISWLARRSPSSRPREAHAPHRFGRRHATPRAGVLARHLAGRAPPLTS